MQTSFRPTRETDHLIHGTVFVRDDDSKPWREKDSYEEGDNHGATSVPKHAPWFEGSPMSILRRLGVTCTDAKRAGDLVNLSEGNLSIFYYIVAASPDGSEEAIKWVLGGLATYLNENGLSFRDVPRVLPADYLKLFCEYLESGKIARNFAKDIFAELLKADFYAKKVIFETEGRMYYDPTTLKSVSVEDLSWEEYEARVDDGTLASMEIKDSYEQPFRHHPNYLLTRIINDPRFKAVDESEIDAIIAKVIADNPAEVEKARANPRAVSWFIGQVIKASKGKASPQVVQAKLKEVFPS